MNEQKEEMKEWGGGSFHATLFRLDATNAGLKRIRAQRCRVPAQEAQRLFSGSALPRS
jgi:hypothetical protein